MFFDFFKKFKPKQIQEEYTELLLKIMDSPLWDGSNEQILRSLPKDLTQDTIEHARQIFLQSHKNS